MLLTNKGNKRAVGGEWGWSLVYYPSYRTFTPSPAHQCEIMVFAFICQRSIFQTSDKRGNWTGNRPKCCKSTKHNYHKALKLPNRTHILKMLKWMSPSHNESFALLCHFFLLIMAQCPPAVKMVNGEYSGPPQHIPHPTPRGRHCVLTGCH